MQYLLELLLIFIIFLSLIPVVKMIRNRNDKKYACLKVLIYSTFFWTIFIVLERVSTSTWLVYYAGLLGYPLRLLFSTLMLCTIFQYVEKKFPKPLLSLLGVLVLIDVVIALTNSSTLYFLELRVEELTSFRDLYLSNNGPIFIYHLVITYVIALASIVLLFVFLAKQKGIRQYKEITTMMAISVVVVLVFNLMQLLVIDTDVNLTYISLVFVAFVLYDVIYRKDMVFNLRASGRSEILTNMREMYILTDASKRIIEVSPSLLEKYQYLEEEVIGQPFDTVALKMANKVTLYRDYFMDEDSSSNKDHYHLREKTFKLKGMNESGHMILLYDETQIFNLLRELNHLSNFDSMTGLHNRNYIEHKIRTFDFTKDVAVFSMDLNGLKINNDYLGHERGDYLLRTLANKIKEVFQDIQRKEIARIGGDEFIVITHEVDIEVLKRKQKQLLAECSHEDIEKSISVSVGLAYDDSGSSSIYTLIQRADALMYEMKSQASKEYQAKMIEYFKLQDQFIR
jgi:diguanylate cyclase (GGDEF)-like protein